jgi:hypothetical protein
VGPQLSHDRTRFTNVVRHIRYEPTVGSSQTRFEDEANSTFSDRLKYKTLTRMIPAFHSQSSGDFAWLA